MKRENSLHMVLISEQAFQRFEEIVSYYDFKNQADYTSEMRGDVLEMIILEKYGEIKSGDDKS